ncbi:MAG: ABC-F family ATP-binding cassette domain-containing protein [Schwartzia succinivorans]|uniref:ribosomal protection-like ABC-F family protein n=1 Tax=Schwartzia succinivorans TaxID=55507 RepID=UPI00235271CD|nr:ABC-F family ATP-binding cassette domain-containing protein [Schwartzia succinivorans]MBE6097187.1 ABC-F family ATP-binding cassette domain-containing protein [Schwartzia succinivorans]
MILSLEGWTKSYGEKRLFTDVNLAVSEGDKIGIVGVNGTGKSTFLKTIAGVLPADEGTIHRMRGLEVEYLEQEKELSPENTVLMEALRGTSPLMEALRSYEMAMAEGDEENIIRFSSRIDALDGWQLESRAKMILTRLGFQDFRKQVGTLSGGERKRLALAAALIRPVDLLLLDEPTNHLDSDTIVWLEEYLRQQKCALLMVTHDRYFLDHTADRILELDKGKTYTYTGNYSSFLEQKAARIEREEAGERKRQNFLRRELSWIRRGAQARSTKQRARIERYEAVKAEKVDLTRPTVEIGLAGSRLGRTVIELENVSALAGSRQIVRDFTYTVRRKDRLAILGPSGAGKSTLLDVFSGRLEPDKGSVTIGQTVKIGYLTQDTAEMDTRMRSVDYIQETARHVTLADGTRLSAVQLMERFLFPEDLQWAPISKLSGGEKRRLFLLRILMESPNVLLLDEPTNDLDLETMQALEGFIDDFAGAIIFVSHDRYFVDRLAERVLVPEADGKWVVYTGGWSEQQARIEESIEAAKEEGSRAEKIPVPEEQKQEVKPSSPKKKLTFKEQKEYAEIEDVIASKEAELKGVEVQMTLVAADDYAELAELTREQTRLSEELDALIERWTYLESVAEQGN